MAVHSTNRESDADIWGLILSMSAGYDPYAAAGTLAKLAMAAGKAGLTRQFEDELSSDAHKSFNSRLDFVFDSLFIACNSSAAAKANCDEYKRIAHPNFPPSVPLLRRNPEP
jgi:predicted Zn-dependent protease